MKYELNWLIRDYFFSTFRKDKSDSKYAEIVKDVLGLKLNDDFTQVSETGVRKKQIILNSFEAYFDNNDENEIYKALEIIDEISLN